MHYTLGPPPPFFLKFYTIKYNYSIEWFHIKREKINLKIKPNEQK